MEPKFKTDKKLLCDSTVPLKKISSEALLSWIVKRQSLWRSKCWFVLWEVRAWHPTKRLNMGDILILWWTEKSMQRCFILFKRCRTCHSQSRCWTCGRRGTFSISWEWRARSKDCGQSSGRSKRIGRRSSTKTFRYIFVWCLTLWETSQGSLGRDLFQGYLSCIWINQLSFLIRSIQVHHWPAKGNPIIKARLNLKAAPRMDTER